MEDTGRGGGEGRGVTRDCNGCIRVRGLSREIPGEIFALRRFDVANSPGFRIARLVYELISRE